MRRIINSTFVSLDGVVERLPEWHFEYHDDQATAIANDELFAADALLMGRRTYEVYAGSWPGRDGAYADRINTMAKHVVSTTLEAAAWEGATVLRGDVVKEVTALKAQPGQDILMHGYGPVARTLLQHGLLDEVRLWIHPVLAGGGDTDELLVDRDTRAALQLAGTRTLDSGVVILAYRPAAAAAAVDVRD